MAEKSGNPIIEIGASAGGVNALAHLVKQLPALSVVAHSGIMNNYREIRRLTG